MLETTMSQFFKDLEKLKDEAALGIMQFRLELGQAIQFRTQDNIKNGFGKGRGSSKSPITERAYGNTAKTSGRSGALRNSVELEFDGTEVQVSVGGPGVPYAAIHEQGGVIRPKNSKYLTLPFHPKYSGTRAGEHSLKFALDQVEGPVLVTKESVPLVHMKDENLSVYDPRDIAYLLRRKVTIPARPYFAPAVEEVSNHDFFRERMIKYFGDRKLGVEVT